MKILVLAAEYPHPGRLSSRIFNEKCVNALSQLCEKVEVLAPRPYVPAFLSFQPRCKSYMVISPYEVRNGVPIYRPATPVIPRIGGALWGDWIAYLGSRWTACRLHRRVRFDALLSFNLGESGGMAWRLGRTLGIPASGWAFGGDMRFPRTSLAGWVVRRAIERLDLIFYQSHELLEQAGHLLGRSAHQMPSNRHIVLPHGIPEPPSLKRSETRWRVRSALQIEDAHWMVLYVGRIVRPKGMFELLEAMSLAGPRDPRIICVMVGSYPAYDETSLLQKKLDQTPGLTGRVKLLPACKPDQVWEYLCAADLFAFPSHQEGMPNSLLEAMVMGVPSIAFAIPAALEIDPSGQGLVVVSPFDSASLAAAILRLADSSAERAQIAERGKAIVRDRFMVRKNMAEALRHLSQLVVTLKKSHVAAVGRRSSAT